MTSSSQQHALNPTKETHSAKCRFYGVYLLCSQSPEKRFKGKCYIGFTVNPQRRISQHNRGMEFGGAKKTNNKGPWKMIMIVHNFPNNIAALQFEWAWQQPAMSTRLKNFPELKRKTTNESYFQYNLRILTRMLNIGPWNRLPLAIRWLDESYECDFEAPFLLKPPAHMSIASGQIVLEKPLSKAKQQLLQQQTQCSSYATRMPECHLCLEYIQDGQSRIGCVNINCKLTCHMICLANQLLAEENQTGHYIPISGVCPICLIPTTWIELLQHKNKNNNSAGSLMSSEEEEEEESENDEAFDCYNNDCAAPAENEAFADEIFELSD